MRRSDYRLEDMEVVNPQIIGVKGNRLLFITDNYNLVFNVDLNQYAQGKLDHLKIIIKKTETR